ncbi:MAG: hypothetical protein WC052_01185 [Patescibacteria group bacterium]|jgi:hypothetical protein
MRVIVVGDTASGKSSFLKTVAAKEFTVQFETFLPTIHPLIYSNLFARRAAFTSYYANRDLDIWTNTVNPVFYEYSVHSMKAFNEASMAAGELNKKQFEALEQLRGSVLDFFPIAKDDVVLHFLCSRKVSNERVLARDGNKHLKSQKYFDIFRSSLEKEFSSCCKYFAIDTTTLTVSDVYSMVVSKPLRWLS